MRVSQNKRQGRLAALPLLAIAGLAWQAIAAAAQQVGPPIPLIPPSSPAPPAASEPAAPLGQPAPVAGEPLAPPPPGWNGETTPPGTALPGDFWHGTPRAVADILLAHLPDTTSPALQSLERRLLLSPATAPRGPDAAGIDRGLPVLRAAALLRLGELDAARAVIGAIPEEDRAAALPLAVDADAIAGEIDRACDTVATAIRQDQRKVWPRDLIACQALHGELDKASLGLQLLAEEKAPHDDALAIAVAALAGRPAATGIERLDAADPLLLRLLVAAGRQLAPALIERLSGDLALTLALDDKAPADTRLAAAERATSCGALAVDQLRAIYAAAAAVGGGGITGNTAIDRARRLTAIAASRDPADRLARIVAFADAFPGHDGGGFLLAARLIAPALREAMPDPALAISAGAAARLLIAAGGDDSAPRWIALAAAAEQPQLRLLLGLARPGGAPSEPAAPDAGLGVKLLALRAALGDMPTTAEWNGLPPAAWVSPGPPAPPPAAALDLADATRGKRVGETVLAAILVAAPRGELSPNPIALRDAVSSLEHIGQDADARRLAVEAALAR